MVHRDKRRPDRVYWRCLKHKKDGHAIYPTLDAAHFKPGVCGYFDRDGDWKLIVDLAIGAEKLRDNGYTALLDDQAITFKDPNNGAQEVWGARISHDMKRTEGAVDVGAKHQGVGVETSVKYKSSSNEAAVLLAQGSITRCHTDVDNQVFLDWMRDNAAKIVKNNKEVKYWGLWIVTKTCSATRRAFSVVESKGTELSWSISAEATDAAKVAPSASWWRNHDTSEWTESSKNTGVVLFMCGIEWRPTRIPWSRDTLKPILEKHKQKHLGVGQDNPVVEVVEGTDSNGELTQFEAHIDFPVDEDESSSQVLGDSELFEAQPAWAEDFSVDEPFEP